MWIVSQDRKQNINLDNVTRIYIEDFSEDGDGFGIGVDTNSAESQCWDLGYYKTEKRAKEVLEEIQERYEHTQYLKCFNRMSDLYEVGIKDFTYEMPKE